MGAVKAETLELIRQWADLLDQQQQMLLKNKWPSFIALKQQSDELWHHLQQCPDELQRLPAEHRQQLREKYRRIELILAGQRHETHRQLKRIRRHKPITKAYRTWNKASMKNNKIGTFSHST